LNRWRITDAHAKPPDRTFLGRDHRLWLLAWGPAKNRPVFPQASPESELEKVLSMGTFTLTISMARTEFGVVQFIGSIERYRDLPARPIPLLHTF